MASRVPVFDSRKRLRFSATLSLVLASWHSRHLAGEADSVAPDEEVCESELVKHCQLVEKVHTEEVPVEECSPREAEVCEDIPVEKCEEVVDYVTVDEPVKACMEVCVTEPTEECTEVPKETCRTVEEPFEYTVEEEKC